MHTLNGLDIDTLHKRIGHGMAKRYIHMSDIHLLFICDISNKVAAVYLKMYTDWNIYIYTVEPPIKDPPRGGHPCYNGHLPRYGLKIP